MRARGSTTSRIGYDGGGNVRFLTNVAGSVTDTNDYDAFGNLIRSTGTTPNVYLYRAEQYDSDLGLYYLRARYYNPLTGRFLSRDPANGDIDSPGTLHKYLYAGGDPVNAEDPTGWDYAETIRITFTVSVSTVVIRALRATLRQLPAISYGKGARHTHTP